MSPTNSSPKPFHIGICGGGIGGLCLAIGLVRRNIPCTIYEAAQAFSEIGAGVAFGPNALQAMELIDPAIRDGYEKHAARNGWEEKKETWFDFRLGMRDWMDVVDLPGQEDQMIASVRAGHSGQSGIHRAHFLDVLARLIPVGVANFGKRLEELQVEGDKMRMIFHDGSSAVADAVVGCDGIKSRTRQILLGKHHKAAAPMFSGKIAYRGLIDMDKVVEVLGDEKARNAQMYLGRHGHVLTLPIQKGATINVVAFQSKRDGKWQDERWVLPTKKEDMLSSFKGWGDSVIGILSAQLMGDPDIWAIFDHPPAPTYYKSRLCLLGDAAHASTPHQGAGAGQAIEDAFILSSLLEQIQSATDIESVFKAYDSVRRPRTQKVVTTSRDAAEIYEFENDRLGNDLVRIGETLNQRYEWIWEFDLHEHLREAQSLM